MQRSRRTLVIAALAALTALVAILLWSSRTDQNAPPREPPPETQRSDLGAPSRVNPAPAPGPAPGRAVRPAVASAPVRLIPAVVERDDSIANGVFVGRVIDWGTGKPVASADVTFAHHGSAVTVRTDPGGEFVFEPPAPGAYRLAAATARGYLPYAPDWGHSPIQLEARPNVRITGIIVYISPAIDYTGLVVDGDDQPVTGAVVRVLDARIGERALAPIRAEYRSDERGEFRFQAPDGAVVEARHPDHGPGRGRVDDAAQVSHRLKIQLGRATGEDPFGGQTLAGAVVDGQGAPIAEARIEALPDGRRPSSRGADSLRWAPQGVTDPDGRFELHGVDPGSYRVIATHDDFAPAATDAEAGDRSIALRMVAAGVIRGRVVTSGGDPVPAFTIAVLRKPSPLREIVASHASVFDGDGRFEIAGLTPGDDYHVRAMAYGFATSDAVPAATSRGDSPGTAEVEITVPTGGVLFGKVVSADGDKPLPSAKVTVEGSIGQGSSALPMSSTAITDDSGDFELAGLAPGPAASVMAAAYNHHPRIVSGLVVTDNARIGPVTIRLTPLKEGETPQIELAGIGAVLGAGDDGLIIQQVIDSGGARDAGLVPGDVIIGVAGDRVLDIGFQGAIQRIRGPVGSTVVLEVRRAEGETVQITATRKKIRA